MVQKLNKSDERNNLLVLSLSCSLLALGFGAYYYYKYYNQRRISHRKDQELESIANENSQLKSANEYLMNENSHVKGEFHKLSAQFIALNEKLKKSPKKA
jgi:cell division protein FtsB